MNLLSSSVSPAHKARARFLSLSTALLLVSGSALAEDTGTAAYDAYVKGLKGLGVEVESGAINYNSANDTLTISDSVWSLEGTIDGFPGQEEAQKNEISYEASLTSSTLTIVGLTHEDGTFELDRWDYSDDTKVVLNGSVVGVGRLEAEALMKGTSAVNYSFTMPELPAKDVDRQVSRWLPFFKTALLAEYDEVLAERTDIEFSVYVGDADSEELFMSGTAAMDGYRIAGARDGFIGEYSIDQITQSIETRDERTGQTLKQETRQGKTVYTDSDFGALIDLFDPEVPVSDDEFVLVGSASSVDYWSKQDIMPGLAAEVTIDSATMDNFTMIKREQDLLGFADQFLAALSKGEEDTIIDSFTPETPVIAMLQLYRSFGVEDARMKGMKIAVPLPGNESGVKVSIDELAMTEVNSDGIGEMLMVGLNAPDLPDGGSIKIDWAAIGDIEFADYAPMKAMISTLVADPSYGENNAIEVARAFSPRSLSYEVEGLDISLPDLGQTKIGKAEMTISSDVPPIPTNLFLRNDGIQLPLEALEEPELEALARALGLENIQWSDETRLTWDETTLELNLERLMIDVKGVGRAELSARLGNVPKAFFQDPMGQGQMAVIVSQFIEASLTFKDAGLATKGLPHFAEAQGIPEDAFREALIEQASQATAIVQNEAFTQMVSEAVTKFLNEPGELSVTLKPANPVPFAQVLGSMAAPQSLPDLLNVNIVAK